MTRRGTNRSRCWSRCSTTACKGFDCQDRLGRGPHFGRPERTMSQTQTVYLASISSFEETVARRMPRLFGRVPKSPHAHRRRVSRLFCWYLRMPAGGSKRPAELCSTLLGAPARGGVAPKCFTRVLEWHAPAGHPRSGLGPPAVIPRRFNRGDRAAHSQRGPH